MNLGMFTDLVANLLTCSGLGDMLAEYEIIEGGNLFTLPSGPPASSMAIFTTNVTSYVGGDRGGSIYYRLCMTASTRCNECFIFFAMALAHQWGGMTLVDVRSSDSKPPSMCATYRVPASACVLPCLICDEECTCKDGECEEE